VAEPVAEAAEEEITEGEAVALVTDEVTDGESDEEPAEGTGDTGIADSVDETSDADKPGEAEEGDRAEAEDDGSDTDQLTSIDEESGEAESDQEGDTVSVEVEPSDSEGQAAEVFGEADVLDTVDEAEEGKDIRLDETVSEDGEARDGCEVDETSADESDSGNADE
jgi:hypothetical protein